MYRICGLTHPISSLAAGAVRTERGGVDGCCIARGLFDSHASVTPAAPVSKLLNNGTGTTGGYQQADGPQPENFRCGCWRDCRTYLSGRARTECRVPCLCSAFRALRACRPLPEGGKLTVSFTERLRRWTGNFFSGFGPGVPRLVPQMLSPASHALLFGLYRVRFIISRARVVAIAFAVLTPLWIAVDVMVFPRTVYLPLLVARLAASAGFAGVAAYRGGAQSGTSGAYRVLALLYLILLAFYLYSQHVLESADLSTVGAAISVGYMFLPFALVVGLSIFPLTLLEIVGLTLPLAVVAAVPLLALPGLDGAMLLWLLLLVVAISTVASVSQLGLMYELFQGSAIDPLTGVYNRRSGEEFLAQQFDLARRYGFRLSLVFLDLDNFKQLNDVAGHNAGDTALRETARLLRSNMRTSDILVRWGGEEFLLVLPHTSIEEAQRQLARLCRDGRCRVYQWSDGAELTFSAGIAEFLRDSVLPTADWRALLVLADRRMYQAKAKGKARIVADDNGEEPRYDMQDGSALD